jgi:allophanate hydrolase subunit 1
MFGWFKRNGNPEEIQEIRQIQLATARDLAHLTETVNLQASNISGLVDVVQALTNDVVGLKAGQEQQARVLDYLLRKEQERQNDGG